MTATAPAPPPAGVLRSLADAVHARTTLAWCVAHGPDPARALAEAWVASESGRVLRTLLAAIDHPASAPGAELYPDELYCGSFLCDLAGDCAGCADAVRRVVPTLTLADVLAPEARRAG